LCDLSQNTILVIGIQTAHSPACSAVGSIYGLRDCRNDENGHYTSQLGVLQSCAVLAQR
jgi:hypothetical protein